MLKINEIFWSAQGEGSRSGIPSIFIRLAGCSLRCTYCDTRRAWSHGRWMSVEAVVSAVNKLKASYPSSHLVVTGGEPLEQDLGELVAAFRRRHWYTAIESNGLHFQDLPFDWWAVSPKDIASYKVHPRLWTMINEIKLLVTPALDLAVIKKMRRHTPAPIILQPERYDRRRYSRTFVFFESCCASGIPGLRLGMQLHAVFGIR